MCVCVCVCVYCNLTGKPTPKGILWMSCRTPQDGQYDNINITGSTAQIRLSDPSSQIASGAERVYRAWTHSPSSVQYATTREARSLAVLILRHLLSRPYSW